MTATTDPLDPRDADVPAPPGAVRDLHRRERRRLLTEEAIVAAALRITAAQGVAAVTMRRVAEDLGVAASSLYPHVGSRERLVDLAVREVLRGVGPLPDSGDWRADLRGHVLEVHERLSAHADLAQHAFFSAVAPSTAEDLEALEHLLARLTGEGLDADLVLTAYDRMMLCTVADVHEQWQRRHRVDDAEVTAWLATFSAHVAELPEDRFPHLRTRARQLVAPEPTARFLTGIDLLLDGLAARS